MFMSLQFRQCINTVSREKFIPQNLYKYSKLRHIIYLFTFILNLFTYIYTWDINYFLSLALTWHYIMLLSITSTNFMHKNILILHLIGGTQSRAPLQKEAYATLSGAHTVFFSKRRKNSSLCVHRVAPCSDQAKLVGFILKPWDINFVDLLMWD